MTHLEVQTSRVINRIKAEKNELKKLSLLYGFVTYLWKRVPPQVVALVGGVKYITWDSLLEEMEALGRKWSFPRVYSLYLYYLNIKKEFEDKNHVFVMGEDEGRLYTA